MYVCKCTCINTNMCGQTLTHKYTHRTSRTGFPKISGVLYLFDWELKKKKKKGYLKIRYLLLGLEILEWFVLGERVLEEGQSSRQARGQGLWVLYSRNQGPDSQSQLHGGTRTREGSPRGKAWSQQRFFSMLSKALYCPIEDPCKCGQNRHEWPQWEMGTKGFIRDSRKGGKLPPNHEDWISCLPIKVGFSNLLDSRKTNWHFLCI